MNETRREPYRDGETRQRGEDVLGSSPFPGNLDAELAAAPRRAGVSKLTAALGAGVIFVAGVIAGIQAHKVFGGDDDGGGRNAVAAGGPRSGGQQGSGQGGPGQGGFGQGRGQGGFGGGPGGGFGGGFGGGTIGTVSRVDGTTIYVQTMQGETVTVRTGDDTRIQVTKDGKVGDLKQGTTVIVRGERADDGSVDATEVSQTGTRGGRGGFGGGFGGGPGGGFGGGRGGGGTQDGGTQDGGAPNGAQGAGNAGGG